MYQNQLKEVEEMEMIDENEEQKDLEEYDEGRKTSLVEMKEHRDDDALLILDTEEEVRPAKETKTNMIMNIDETKIGNKDDELMENNKHNNLDSQNEPPPADTSTKEESEESNGKEDEDSEDIPPPSPKFMIKCGMVYMMSGYMQQCMQPWRI